MDDFQFESAGIETVDAWHHALHLQVTITGVDHLLPEGVLLVVIHCEVGAQSFVEEAVTTLEYHLDAVLSSLTQQLSWEADAVVHEYDIAGVYAAAVHH